MPIFKPTFSPQQRPRELNCWSCSWPSTPSTRNNQNRELHMVFSLPSGTTISNTKHHRGRHVTNKSVIQSNNSHQQRSAELNCWSCCWASTPSPCNQQDRHSHMVFSLPSSTAILNRLQPKTTTRTNIFSVNGMSVETVGQEYKDCVLYGSTNSKCYFT